MTIQILVNELEVALRKPLHIVEKRQKHLANASACPTRRNQKKYNRVLVYESCTIAKLDFVTYRWNGPKSFNAAEM